MNRAGIEYCCNCGEPTGNAGRVEDSIYAENVIDDDEIGPLCWGCYHDLVAAKIVKPKD